MGGSHKDRLFSQVPRSLPPHLDGPNVKDFAEAFGLSIGEAKRRLRKRWELKDKIKMRLG